MAEITAKNQGRTALEAVKHENTMRELQARGVVVGSPEWEQAKTRDYQDRVRALEAENNFEAAREMKIIFAEELLGLDVPAGVPIPAVTGEAIAGVAGGAPQVEVAPVEAEPPPDDLPIPQDPNISPEQRVADEEMYDQLKATDPKTLPLGQRQAFEATKEYFKNQYGVSI
jgi:hypothetical protein